MIFLMMMITKKKIRRNKENLKIRKLIKNKIKNNNKKIRRKFQKVKNQNQNNRNHNQQENDLPSRNLSNITNKQSLAVFLFCSRLFHQATLRRLAFDNVTFWRVIIATMLGFGLSFTSVRRLEGDHLHTNN